MVNKHKIWIFIFGLIEIAIGSTTLIALALSLILGKSTKPAGVLMFVILASVMSLSLGIGILRRSLFCRSLLLYFATVVILSKILIFARVITLNGALETSIPAGVKNAISIIYHCLLIWYFSRESTRKEFGEKRNVLFSLKPPF